MPWGICTPTPPRLLGKKVALCPFNAPTFPPPLSTVMVQGVPQQPSGLTQTGMLQVGQVWRDLALGGL